MSMSARKHRRNFTSLLYMLSVVLPSSWCLGQGSAKIERAETRSSALEVTLSTDRNSYKLGDQLNVRVLLENVSSSPFYIFRTLDSGESASVSLWLKDAATGKDVPAMIVADESPPPPSSKDAFLELLPRHVHEVALTTTFANLNVRKSGAYKLIASYHSPIPKTMNFGLPIRGPEDGIVWSNEVTLRVVD
jgi:hypothetical protein